MLTRIARYFGFFLIFYVSLPAYAQTTSPSKIAFEHDNGFGLYAMNADGTNVQLIVNDAYSDSYAAWSPDGKSIAYTSIKSGSPDIYVIDADGSNPRRLTTSGSALYPAWTSDGHHVLFSGKDGINSIDIDGKNLHQLIPRGNTQFALSPDGKSIAYKSNDQIVNANIDGSKGRALTVDLHQLAIIYFLPSWPSWSADSKQIVFESKLRQNTYIYVVNADGKKQHRLNTGGEGIFPSWSPDGKSVVFTQLTRNAQSGDCKTIYSVGINSGVLRRLTDGCHDNYASWSPDSKRVLFISDRDHRIDINTMDFDGSNVSAVSKGAGENTEPVWSPDGKSLVFVSNRDGNREIYKAELGSNSTQRLTDDPHNDHTCPQWSPDQEMISYVSSGTKSGIYVMNADGTDSHLVQFGNRRVGSGCPSWSPDNQHFAFVSNDALYVTDTNGEKPVRLSIYKDKSIGQFVWSPDSQMIAYATAIAAYAVKIDGSSRHNITFAVTYAMAWSADSQHLAFIGQPNNPFGGVPAIVATVDVDGTHQKNLTSIAEGLDSDSTIAWLAHTIVFVAPHDKIHGLYAINDDGTNLRQSGNQSDNVVGFTIQP